MINKLLNDNPSWVKVQMEPSHKEKILLNQGVMYQEENMVYIISHIEGKFIFIRPPNGDDIRTHVMWKWSSINNRYLKTFI